MLRARIDNTFIFGIDAENVKRLMSNRPILVSLAQLGGPDTDIVIMYGDTLDDVMKELEKRGYELPEPSPLPRGEN